MWFGAWDGKAYTVEWLGWGVASAGQKSWLGGVYLDVVVVVHVNGVISEDGGAVVVAELADREKGAGSEAGETM